MPETFTLQEAAYLLGMDKTALRDLLEEYASELEPLMVRDADLVRLTWSCLNAVSDIARLRTEGRTREEIIEHLARSAPAAAGDAGTGEESPERAVLQQLDRLRRELALSERRRMEDRDKLLVALMRTQQEIRQLRYELAAHSSRRQRRRRGLFAWLFGP